MLLTAARLRYETVHLVCMHSLGGQNEVLWLPGRTPPAPTRREEDAAGRMGGGSVEGLLLRKSPVSSSPQRAAGGGIWQRRAFVLDNDHHNLSFYSEVGFRRSPLETLNLSAGSVQDAVEADTGRPHSFVLKCKGKSPASNDDIVVLAAMDADMKARVVGALCSSMGCSMMSPAAASSPRIRGTRLTLALAEDRDRGQNTGRNSLPDVEAAATNHSTVLSGGGNRTASDSDMEAEQQLTKQQVVERARAARLKLQTDKISQLRSEEHLRKQAESQSTLNDLLGELCFICMYILCM
jgi:hypothetical protein